MKHLIKNSVKFGILFCIGITIFYTSCQNEDDLNQLHNSIKSTKPEYIIKTINRQKINENMAVARVLDKITEPKSITQLHAYSRLVTYENLNVVVNDDYANYLEKPDGSYHSYTFKAVDLDFPEKKKNLILSLKDDGNSHDITTNNNGCSFYCTFLFWNKIISKIYEY